MQMRLLGRLLDRGLIDLVRRHAKRNVGSDRVVRQKNHLRYVAQRPLPSANADCLEPLAIDQDLPRCRPQQADDEIGERALARSRGAHDANSLSPIDTQRYIRQYCPLLSLVAEIERPHIDPVDQGDGLRHRVDILAPGSLRRFVVRIECIEGRR